MVLPGVFQDRSEAAGMQVGEEELAEVVQLPGGPGDRLETVELQVAADELRDTRDPALVGPVAGPAERGRQVHGAFLDDEQAAGPGGRG